MKVVDKSLLPSFNSENSLQVEGDKISFSLFITSRVNLHSRIRIDRSKGFTAV